MTQGFGDFTEDDAIDDGDLPTAMIDWDEVERLQRRMDEINIIPNPEERKLAAKALTRELNGDDSGPILVT